MGLLCLAIRNSNENNIGRTKLQKMIYFADRYLDWDVGDYRLHYYGPYSRNIASTLKTIRGQLINEQMPDHGPYGYELTEDGNRFLAEFADNVCDSAQIESTSELFRELSQWKRAQLEIASTIDYVQRNNPTANRDSILEQVQTIKDNFPPDFITQTYGQWHAWKEEHHFDT